MPEPNKLKKSVINLLPQDMREVKHYTFLRRLSFIVLSIYIIGLLALFGISVFLNFQKNDLSQKNEQLSASIQSQKDKEGLLKTIKDRLNISRSTFSKSSPSASELVDNVLSFLPSDVSLLNVEADEDGNTTLVVETENSLGVSRFVQELEGKNLSQVELSSLALNPEGKYTMSLLIKQ